MGNNTTSKKTDGQMAKKNQIPAFKGKPQLGWDSRVKQQRPQQGESAKTETQTKRMQFPPRRGIYETMDMSRAELEKEILALGYDLDDGTLLQES